MIDTHAHLFDDDFDNDLKNVIADAKSSGVDAILMPAIEPSSFQKMIDLAENNEMLYCSIGIHPHNSLEFNSEAIKLIEAQIQNPKVKAIGEIGLDYYYDFAPKDIQRNAFIEQIDIAKKFNLPIIVHNRESDDDVLDILNSKQDGTLKGVLHCFSSNLDFLNKALSLGFFVSFTGNITFKKADELRLIVRETPLEKILLETDSPWMAPVPFRGKRNEPKFLKLIAEKIAEIKSIDIDEVIRMTTKSAKELFKLMIILLISLIFQTNNTFSQQENYEENSMKFDTSKTEHNFYKYFGISPVIGTNTVVNTFSPGGQDISLDGLLSYGFGLWSNPVEWGFVNFDYLHFVNNKPHEFSDSLDPERSNLYELSMGIILNPNGRVNFYALAGYSIVNTTYSMYNWNEKHKYILEDTRHGIAAGLGFFANLPTNNAGIFVLNAEWRLDFILETTYLNYDPRKAIDDPLYLTKSDYTTFFSIPRISIIWYPPLDEWFNLKF